MIIKDILSVLEDIAESLRVIAKRDSDFPIGQKATENQVIEFSSSNLTELNKQAEEVIQEKISKQMEERGENFFFAEDVVDEDLITGGLI